MFLRYQRLPLFDHLLVQLFIANVLPEEQTLYHDFKFKYAERSNMLVNNSNE